MVELKNISKSFAGKQVLKELDLIVKKGETLSIVGPSGQGKSVTLGHITGRLTPDEGEIFVDGIALNNITQKNYSRVIEKLGVLFQSSALLAWLTIEQNVALPLIEKRKFPKKKNR